MSTSAVHTMPVEESDIRHLFGGSVMGEHAVCLVCYEDWCEPGKHACRSCLMSQSMRLGMTTKNVRPSVRRGWWGPTSRDVNPEDIANGFTISEV